MGICRTYEFECNRAGHVSGMGPRIKFSGIKKNRPLSQGRNEAEDRVVSRVFMNMVFDELKTMGKGLREKIQLFKDGKLDLKELKREMGDHQIVLWAIMYTHAIENENEKEIKLWGEKIESYCVQKPKPDSGGESTGADHFMEAMATFVESKTEPKRLPKPKKA